MAQPDEEPSDPRADPVNQAPAPDVDVQPASDQPVPIDDLPVPPLTDPTDTKGG